MNIAPPPKIPLDGLISLLEPAHKDVAERICEDYKEVLFVIPGSIHKHQAWEGGYVSHIEEAMNLGIILYHQLSIRRPLDFTLSSLLFCLFLHDFDKLLRYEPTPSGAQRKTEYSKNYLETTSRLLSDTYGYILTDDEYKGIKYAHAEPDSEYNPESRVTNTLGALVHCCDYISARIWHDYGKLHESWEA